MSARADLDYWRNVLILAGVSTLGIVTRKI